MDLTTLTEAGGCGCKIAPNFLSGVLNNIQVTKNDFVHIGFNDRDDAAIWETPNSGDLIVSTLDFFSPVVDTPYEFGKIAAANSLSDVYAMGAKPMVAMAIMGVPNEVTQSVAQAILEGGHETCNRAGVSLIGGHTIKNPQPIFGLSVNGIVSKKSIKRNNGAKNRDLLYLTKPLGLGIMSTALKLGKISQKDKELTIALMSRLNSDGLFLSEKKYINSMTDITGFGLAGHILEICRASKCDAYLDFLKIPTIRNLAFYINDIETSGGKRNWESYSSHVSFIDEHTKRVLCDPQTNGGLLICVDPRFQNQFEKEYEDETGLKLKSIGELKTQKELEPKIKNDI